MIKAFFSNKLSPRTEETIKELKTLEAVSRSFIKEGKITPEEFQKKYEEKRQESEKIYKEINEELDKQDSCSIF